MAWQKFQPSRSGRSLRLPSLLSPGAPHIDTAHYFYNISIHTQRKQWSVNLITLDSQLALLDQYIKPWQRVYPGSKIAKVRSIKSALELAKGIGAEGNSTHVLITGSLHVVGEALRIIGC